MHAKRDCIINLLLLFLLLCDDSCVVVCKFLTTVDCRCIKDRNTAKSNNRTSCTLPLTLFGNDDVVDTDDVADAVS